MMDHKDNDTCTCVMKNRGPVLIIITKDKRLFFSSLPFLNPKICLHILFFRLRRAKKNNIIIMSLLRWPKRTAVNYNRRALYLSWKPLIGVSVFLCHNSSPTIPPLSFQGTRIGFIILYLRCARHRVIKSILNAQSDDRCTSYAYICNIAYCAKKIVYDTRVFIYIT